MTPIILVLLLVVAVVAGVAGYALGRGAAGQAAVDAETVEAVRREVLGLRALVSRLKDTAWDHRELDSALATIIVDEIRTYERKELGE
jgi:hypothetical protein